MRIEPGGPARFLTDDVEISRLQSVMQGGRECHECSCHIYPPCAACVECEVCSDQEGEA